MNPPVHRFGHQDSDDDTSKRGRTTIGRRGLPSAALLVGTALLFSGLTAAAMTIARGHDSWPPVATRSAAHSGRSGASASTSGSPQAAPTTTPVAVASPIDVQIPTIRVSAKVDPMGLTNDGRLEVPTKYQRVGWWSGGPKPGQRGPSVLEGHVDSTKGPAVFYALRLLRPGDEIRVIRSDLTTAVFVVDRLGSYPKNEFPTLDVYGPTEAPTLRLITCTGTFNRTRHSYNNNLVVYANLKT